MISPSEILCRLHPTSHSLSQSARAVGDRTHGMMGCGVLKPDVRPYTPSFPPPPHPPPPPSTSPPPPSLTSLPLCPSSPPSCPYIIPPPSPFPVPLPVPPCPLPLPIPSLAPARSPPPAPLWYRRWITLRLR